MAECVEVPLSKGMVALVDAADGERAMAHRWFASKGPTGLWYAIRQEYGPRRQIGLARFIVGVAPGEKCRVIHRNGDSLDCRRENLLIVEETGRPYLGKSITIGQRFGRWEVLGIGERDPKHRDRRIDCRCDCGAARSLLQRTLTSGKSTSCGCTRFRGTVATFELACCPEAISGCWLWEHGTNPSGYGVLKFGLAHRVAWELYRGPIPDGLDVLHRCDTPSCVNPDHLFVGTHQDNMADMAAKGRAAAGQRSGARRYPESIPAGERNGHAKLTAESVRTARNRHASDGVGPRELARELGVTESTVRSMLKGETWRKVQ